jgi:hypothetical protein
MEPEHCGICALPKQDQFLQRWRKNPLESGGQYIPDTYKGPKKVRFWRLCAIVARLDKAIDLG